MFVEIVIIRGKTRFYQVIIIHTVRLKMMGPCLNIMGPCLIIMGIALPCLIIKEPRLKKGNPVSKLREILLCLRAN